MKKVNNIYVSAKEVRRQRRIKILINTLIIIIPLLSALSFAIYDIIINEGINL